MSIIEELRGLEILDSRGRPTVQAACRLRNGALATASVPSGASTGEGEALELRDEDPDRYTGLGCRRAVRHVNGELDSALSGRSFADQTDLDRAMIELDGTPDKSRLGANAILAVSMAFARARARSRGIPLFEELRDMLQEEVPIDRLPRPTINLFSGGLHAGGQIPLQDVLIVPTSASSIDELLSVSYDIYQSAASLVDEKYGMRRLTADEGGLAPPFDSADAMLQDAVLAIQRAGFIPGEDVNLAVDVAASHFYDGGVYHLGEERVPAAQMIDAISGWLDRYPIASLEDGLAENDWPAWAELRSRIEGRALVLGDDLLCTNPKRIRRAIDAGAADALLLKVNQIGTLTEAAEAYRLARSADWQVTISARSGETEDNWLADLAVGWRGDQIKVGSISQSDRLAKYNRLLAIEATTNLPVNPWPGRV